MSEQEKLESIKEPPPPEPSKADDKSSQEAAQFSRAAKGTSAGVRADLSNEKHIAALEQRAVDHLEECRRLRLCHAEEIEKLKAIRHEEISDLKAQLTAERTELKGERDALGGLRVKNVILAERLSAFGWPVFLAGAMMAVGSVVVGVAGITDVVPKENVKTVASVGVAIVACGFFFSTVCVFRANRAMPD